MPPRGRRWTFFTTVENRENHKSQLRLVQLNDIPIERHIKVRGTASPDDPELDDYWHKRQTQYGKSYWSRGTKLHQVAEHQNWHCPVCGEHLLMAKNCKLITLSPLWWVARIMQIT